jgi:putative transposase
VTNTRYTRKTAPKDWLQVQEWIDPDTSQWGENARKRYNILRAAISDYIEGKNVSGYLSDNNVSWETLLRAFNRCLARDNRGRPLGWHGLVRGARVRTTVRTKELTQCGRDGKGGLAGAMQYFLACHPDLRRRFDLYLLENAKRMLGSESSLRQKSAHGYFIKLCEQEKISPAEWPLNAGKQGRGAVRRYVKSFIDARYDDIVSTHFGQKAAAKANTGTGLFTRLTASRLYDVVELDEHSAHFIGSVGIPTDDGTRWLDIGRLTIIAIADRKGATLGAKVICRREANSDDMLDVFDAAFGGAPSHKYSSSTYDALDGAFPASLGEPFRSCAFNQLLVDSALAHIAEPLMERARGTGGFDVNFGPVGRFERRPVIEGVFNALERLGFHRMPSTTGTGPSDPRRQQPEKAAVSARIGLEDLIDLTIAVLADANTREGKANFGRSHLNFLRDLVADVDGFGMLFPVIPPRPAGTPALSVSIIPVTVRGDQKKGRRPYVYFDEEMYVGTELANMWSLIGTDVVAHVRRTDIRTLELRTVTGSFIDSVTVSGRWRHSPHSLDVRRHINWMIRQGYLKVRYDEDPINAHLEALKKRAESSRRSERSVTKAMATAHAEQERVGAQNASDIAGRALEETIGAIKDQADAPASASEDGDDEDYLLDDLTAINGGSK